MEIFTLARNKLEVTHPEIVNNIEECIKYGATGGEIISCVGKILFDLKKNQNGVYDALKKEGDEYLEMCAENGLTFE